MQEKVKECSFQPNLRSSESSYQHLHRTKVRVHPGDQKKMKGVDKFLHRFQQAQQRKMEEAEAFLMPSEKRKNSKLLSKGDLRHFENHAATPQKPQRGGSSKRNKYQ